MLAVYLFCLVVGGGLALLAVFGDVVDGADVDGVDLDGVDLDVDADVELDAGADAAPTGGDVVAAEGPELEGSAAETARLFSIRGLIYGAFGFGTIGTLFHWLFPERDLFTLGFAVAGGLLTAVLVTRLLAWLRGSEAGAERSDRGYAGRAGRVLLPIGRDSPGQIRVRRAGRTERLRALPFESGREGADAAGGPALAARPDPGDWEEVVIVEVREGIAYVRPKEEMEWT